MIARLKFLRRISAYHFCPASPSYTSRVYAIRSVLRPVSLTCACLRGRPDHRFGESGNHFRATNNTHLGFAADALRDRRADPDLPA